MPSILWGAHATESAADRAELSPDGKLLVTVLDDKLTLHHLDSGERNDVDAPPSSSCLLWVGNDKLCVGNNLMYY